MLFSPGQYDLLTVDKPERQRKRRPEEAVVEQLRLIFSHDSDRMLYCAGRKLYDSIGAEYTRIGLDALARLPGWSNAIIKHGVSCMTQTTRIEQAACAQDKTERGIVEIRLDLGKRQQLMAEVEVELTAFMQELHTTHPAMRKQIKSAAEMVMKAAFRVDVNNAPQLMRSALESARKDKARIQSIVTMYKPPKETAQWLTQILVRL